MRYTIEAKTKKQEGTIEEFVKKNNIKIVDAYDPIEKVSRDVDKLGIAMRRFQKSDIDWSIFNDYLRGNGHSQKLIDSVLGDVKQFFVRMKMLPEKKWNQATRRYEYTP